METTKSKMPPAWLLFNTLVREFTPQEMQGITEANERPANWQSNSRSEPGQGRMMLCYVVNPAAADLNDPDNMCGGGLVEDFSTCKWPVCVKVHPKLPADIAARGLREIADLIERSPGHPLIRLGDGLPEPSIPPGWEMIESSDSEWDPFRDEPLYDAG